MPPKPKTDNAPADDAFAESTAPPDAPVDVTATADKVASDEDGEYRVVMLHNNDAVFSGSKDDATEYLEKNFPRPHVEHGRVKYPAVLVAPSGTATHYHVDSGWENHEDA